MTDVKEEVGPRAAARAQRRPRFVAWIVVVVLVLASAGVVVAATTKDLAGLDLGAKPAASAAASPSASASASAAATAQALARFDAAASDQANLQLFRTTLDKVARAHSSTDVTGKVLTDGLVASGFDPAAMQHTADQTSANLQAPTLTVSFRLEKSCLIGQFVRSDASITAEVTAPIQTGACLIGETVPVK